MRVRIAPPPRLRPSCALSSDWSIVVSGLCPSRPWFMSGSGTSMVIGEELRNCEPMGCPRSWKGQIISVVFKIRSHIQDKRQSFRLHSVFLTSVTIIFTNKNYTSTLHGQNNIMCMNKSKAIFTSFKNICIYVRNVCTFAKHSELLAIICSSPFPELIPTSVLLLAGSSDSNAQVLVLLGLQRSRQKKGHHPVPRHCRGRQELDHHRPALRSAIPHQKH